MFPLVSVYFVLLQPRRFILLKKKNFGVLSDVSSALLYIQALRDRESCCDKEEA